MTFSISDNDNDDDGDDYDDFNLCPLQATTWNSDIKCWKLPRYDRSNYNIINDGNASANKDNEIASIKGNL